MAARIRIGTIGWDHPEWVGDFYPAGAKPSTFLRRYAERFPLVEAASSYYGMPRASVVASWNAHTPDGFCLALKLPDWIVRKSPDDPDLSRALDTFLQHMAPLASTGKLGTIVAQFHPNYRHEKRADDLAAFVARLPPDARWAVELRDASWWREDTYDMLREADVTLVWSDLGAGQRTPAVRTTDSVYVRLLGDRVLPAPYDTKRRDAADTLHHWADRILDEGRDAVRADVVVSKFLEGYAPASAETLARMLDLPPGAFASQPRGPRQTTLM